MGRVLQVRVMAYTFDPREVERQWPALYRLTFPSTAESEHGVRELVASFADRLRFGAVPKEIKEALTPGSDKAEAVVARLEAALGEWDSRQANKITDELEEVLDQMEKKARLLERQL